MNDKDKNYDECLKKMHSLETKIRKLELDKKKLYSIIRHFAFENNVNNSFIRELVKIYNEDLKI